MSPISITKRDQILRMFKMSNILRPRDVEAVGVSRTYLNKLLAGESWIAPAGDFMCWRMTNRRSSGLWLRSLDEFHGMSSVYFRPCSSTV